MSYSMYRLSERPDLREQVALGHIVPLVWNGTAEDLPAKIDDIIIRALGAKGDQLQPNTVSALAAIVTAQYQGRGLSTTIVREMKAVALQHGCTSLIAPVRPTWKSRYPLVPLERYVTWTRADGAPFDPWLRVHWRMGAKQLHFAPNTLTVTASVAQWEQWTGLPMPGSGEYVISGALQPVVIDRASDIGVYEDPNVCDFMSLIIIRQDITKMNVDAIVNPTNRRLQQGGGVCGAIFKAAGEAELQNACDKLAPIETGEAVITPGFGLPAKYVIHTAGPVYRGGGSGEEVQLRTCYVNSLKRAVENGCESVAFPLIATGRNGYPKKEALDVARAAIEEFLGSLNDDEAPAPHRHGASDGRDDLAGHQLDVYLTVFDKEAFTVSEQLMGELQSYIDDHYVATRADRRRRAFWLEEETETVLEPESHMSYSLQDDAPATLDAWLDNLDEPFSDTLLRLIDAKGMTDVEVYKRANIDRRVFSSIRTDKNYTPRKRTILALAIAMRLSLEETDDLLKRAGHALSPNQKFDVIVQFFILQGEYDIFEINAALANHDQALLGL